MKDEDRSQQTMLPACLDDYIAEDNPVRLIDAFIEIWTLLRSVSDAFSQRRPGVPPITRRISTAYQAPTAAELEEVQAQS